MKSVSKKIAFIVVGLSSFYLLGCNGFKALPLSESGSLTALSSVETTSSTDEESGDDGIDNGENGDGDGTSTPTPTPTATDESSTDDTSSDDDSTTTDASALLEGVLQYWINPGDRFPYTYLTTTNEIPSFALLNGPVFRIFSTPEVPNHLTVPLYRLENEAGDSIFLTVIYFNGYHSMSILGYISMFPSTVTPLPLYKCFTNHTGEVSLTTSEFTCTSVWGGLLNPTPIGYVAPIQQ